MQAFIWSTQFNAVIKMLKHFKVMFYLYSVAYYILDLVQNSEYWVDLTRWRPYQLSRPYQMIFQFRTSTHTTKYSVFTWVLIYLKCHIKAIFKYNTTYLTCFVRAEVPNSTLTDIYNWWSLLEFGLYHCITIQQL